MSNVATKRLNLKTLHRSTYGWPLRQLRIPKAHRVTRGRTDVVVAVIDIGYRPHPQHEGHLWVNPSPTQGDVHGWDFADDDATLAYTGHDPESNYRSGHHAFVVGEVIACAPQCPVMVLRVGYQTPDSWARAIDYAVEHGARVLALPHAYLNGTSPEGVPHFYQGTDFAYPFDNPGLRDAYERAVDAGVLMVSGTCDNRGRRCVSASSAFEGVMAVGSSDRRGEAADIAPAADYVEVAAPGGRRDTNDPLEQIWCTGGHENYIPLTGGCMATGFAAGVAALVWSQFPHLEVTALRQVLRNTAQGKAWHERLGWGLLDAARAVSLKPEQLTQRLRVDDSVRTIKHGRRQSVMSVALRNDGALDAQRAMVVAYTGHPHRPVDRSGSLTEPIVLKTRQVGHAMSSVRGFDSSTIPLRLTEKVEGPIWLEVSCLDHHGSPEVVVQQVKPGEGRGN